MNRMLNNTIKFGKFPSATVKDCHFDIPATRDAALIGGKHLHLQLAFKNGNKWVVHVALQGGTTSPQELLIQEMSSEVATLIALENVGLESVPLGFIDFSESWNAGVYERDPRRVSKITLSNNPEENVLEPSTHPLHLKDFYITPEQTGLVDDVRHNSTTSIQNDIMQEFAAIMLTKQRNQRRGYKERREKRLQAYSAGPSSQHDPFFTRFNARTKRSHIIQVRSKDGTPASEISSEEPVEVPIPSPVDVPPPMETVDPPMMESME